MVETKDDLGAFTILCIIEAFDFARALCDLGASINLMPLAVYKQLGLGSLMPTIMRLLMVDRSLKRPVGILCGVLVHVGRFIFPADFVILDFQVDFEVPIILGRPLLAISRTLVDIKQVELTFRLNTKEVKFSVRAAMRRPKELTVMSNFDVEEDSLSEI
ncbi:MAG: retropepsin-like aspartic protease [Candidatus Phytoplasma australasiaticum]|nr:retropepsin-like aspartic protease [Candidatus Phytoplasma australasiaticum]